ncbi:MAG: SIMPL domain-containing protein [Candidatus Cloacimonadaceae bacterium]
MSKRPARIIGLSFIIGMLIFGIYFAKSRQEPKTLRIVGYASKQFVSDMVKWNLTVQKTADVNSLSAAYKKLASDVNDFKAYLVTNGIPAKEISIQPITSNPMYDNYGHITSYNLTQNIFVISNQLDNIEKLSLNPDFFAERGLLLQMSNLSYLYTKLPELKKQLLGEATSDALKRAKEVSSAAKVKLSKMREAKAGVFQITEPYSTDVSDYGIYNTSTRDKSISVTITAVFGLK